MTTDLFLAPGAGNESGGIRGKNLRERVSAPRTYMTDKPFLWVVRSAYRGSRLSGGTRTPAHVWPWSTGHTWADDRRISGRSVNSGGHEVHSGWYVTHNFPLPVRGGVGERQKERGRGELTDMACRSCGRGRGGGDRPWGRGGRSGGERERGLRVAGVRWTSDGIHRDIKLGSGRQSERTSVGDF